MDPQSDDRTAAQRAMRMPEIGLAINTSSRLTENTFRLKHTLPTLGSVAKKTWADDSWQHFIRAAGTAEGT